MKKPLKYSRKHRRGISLLELTLSLVVISFITSNWVELSTKHIQRKQVQRTAVFLSSLADELEVYATNEFHDLFPNPAEGEEPEELSEYSWTELRADSAISLDADPVTPLKQTVTVFFQEIDDSIYVVLLTEGSPSPLPPRPEGGSRFVGMVDATDPDVLRGWDFEFDITDIKAEADRTFLNSIGVIRQVSDRIDISPFLHRFDVPSNPELNSMEGNLEFEGESVLSAATIEVETMTVSSDITVTGTATVGTLTVSGEATLEDVTATEITSDTITATIIDTTTLNSDTAEIVTLTTDSLTGATRGEVETLTAVTADITTLEIDTVDVTDLEITGNLTVNGHIQTKTLDTEECDGCVP